MWVVTVLTSEFFWGVIVGLVLSVIGAYYLTIFATRQQRKAQKDLMVPQVVMSILVGL
jgi:hypothetical protein